MLMLALAECDNNDNAPAGGEKKMRLLITKRPLQKTQFSKNSPRQSDKTGTTGAGKALIAGSL